MSYDAPPICEREILRYAGCKYADSEISSLLASCLNELGKKLSYKVCFRELSVEINDGVCNFDLFALRSSKLAANLSGCKRTILFAATIGFEIDRLIAKHSRLSPAKALMFQAIGTERIEALCDKFCEETKLKMDCGMKPRFSPGYGDLPLDAQKEIFSILDCGRQIGISLNDSLLMSPSKSVTAFAGLCSKENTIVINKCLSCSKQDCVYRCI